MGGGQRGSCQEFAKSSEDPIHPTTSRSARSASALQREESGPATEIGAAALFGLSWTLIDGAAMASQASGVIGVDTRMWEERALWLARATIAWNVIEGLVAMGFGIGEESVALFGFGVDSWVEVGSAAVVHWKLTRPASTCQTTAKKRERTATKWISALLLVLALGTVLGATIQLVSGRHPDSSVPSLVISVLSLAFMAFLWRAKRSAARALDSRTLALDARCSLGCIELSLVLLAGSLIYVVVPVLWWADAVAALGIAALIGREGWEGWKAASKPDFSGGCGCSG